MTLEELYRSYWADGEEGEHSRAFLAQTHWFTTNAVFDPRTGEALPQDLSKFLNRITNPVPVGVIEDRLWRITDHARSAVGRVFRALSESPRREQAFLPVRSVRELDASSFIKLSNRPGRNIREKLASKPYLHAVRRFQSVDLPENRLLKAFVTRLAELLELRYDCLKEEEDELLLKIQSWLLGDGAQAIARWENLPPNNALLSHRDYRRIWDAWRWLQTLDDDITRDNSQFEARKKTMELWDEYGRKYSDGKHLFANMPVCFDYGEALEIRPWVKTLLVQHQKEKMIRHPKKGKITQPVCVDLTSLRPRYSLQGHEMHKARVETLHETYIWQRWKNENESVDINLFNSDALFIHSDAITISSVDLFFSKDKQDEHLDRAAFEFASKLNETFASDRLIWLVPDFLNDFELGITRHNLNGRFPNAEPLPRSVAAVFAQADYSKITNDGFPIIVIDTVGGKTCVTKLIARFDIDLKERVPETYGYYWERCPPVIISTNDSEETEIKNYEIDTVDETGKWYGKTQPKSPQLLDIHALKKNKQIGDFAYHIIITQNKSPVAGGVHFNVLRQKAGDIPLWRDHIPELSIKVIKNGIYQSHYLVSRNTTIEPIRGRPVPINIPEYFTLPAKKQYYQFPLFQGENADELGFSARLDSSAFPLNTDTVCRLNMTFTYGADDPYCLIFEPLKNEFSPVLAKWRKVKGEIITDAPAPPYPRPLLWEDLKHWKNTRGREMNLLDWLLDFLTRLNDGIINRSQMTISKWASKKDENGEVLYWFAFAKTENGDCYLKDKWIIDPFQKDPSIAFPVGTKLFATIKKTHDDKLNAFDVSTKRNIAFYIWRLWENGLKNRMPLIWTDNRSLEDTNAPREFKEKCKELIFSLSNHLPNEIFEKEFLPILSCLHKDTTDECIQWIMKQVDNGNSFYLRAIGLALGDVSQPWQETILSKLVLQLTSEALRIFAYAIWREQHFVEKFKKQELELILGKLNIMLSEIRPCLNRKDKWVARDWARATAEPLELLLGLLRTRASSDPDIKMILQPHQKITLELVEKIKCITEIVTQSNGLLFSRIQLDVQKPEGDPTPDLLYALHLYLSGDGGANAIHITGVSDDEKDGD